MTCFLPSYAVDLLVPINLVLQTVLFSCNLGVFISNLCEFESFFVFTINNIYCGVFELNRPQTSIVVISMVELSHGLFR